MLLNEQAQKIDTQLEMTCKKFEKVALDSGNVAQKELMFMDGNNQRSYRDYIKTFEW